MGWGLVSTRFRFCARCQGPRPLDWNRVICAGCEMEDRQADHDIIVRAPVLTISDRLPAARKARHKPEPVRVAPSGRVILSLRRRA
jgi:hypothetical protein